MLPYQRFKDEAEFREKFVKPLLNRLGYYGVSEQHGTQEFGKDFVFSELHRLGGMRHYAAQVKHEERMTQGASIDGLLSQVRQAFATLFTRADSPGECYVSSVYVFNSGEITSNAKKQLLDGLGREHYGDNVHFLDGERLEALNEWATLQSDANARARLLGLRSALQFNIRLLEEGYVNGTSKHLAPMYNQGLELYLSEPVNCDNQLLEELFVLLECFRSIEEMRKLMAPPFRDEKAKERLWPALMELGQSGLRVAIKLHKKVDTLIEKMKPLGK